MNYNILKHYDIIIIGSGIYYIKMIKLHSDD